MIAENMIDHVCRQLNLSALDVRRINMYRPAGDYTHFGQLIEPFNVPRMWGDLLARAQVQQRQRDIVAFNAANRYRKRGLCVLPTKFGCSFTAKVCETYQVLLFSHHFSHLTFFHKCLTVHESRRSVSAGVR